MTKSSKAKTFTPRKPTQAPYRRDDLRSIPSIMTKATDKTGTDTLRKF